VPQDGTRPPVHSGCLAAGDGAAAICIPGTHQRQGAVSRPSFQSTTDRIWTEPPAAAHRPTERPVSGKEPRSGSKQRAHRDAHGGGYGSGRAMGHYLLYRHDVPHRFLCMLNHSSNELEQVEQIEHFGDPRTIQNLERLNQRLQNQQLSDGWDIPLFRNPARARPLQGRISGTARPPQRGRKTIWGRGARRPPC